MDNLERMVIEADHDDGKLIGDLLNVPEKNIDDSDEAIVVGEVISNPNLTFAEYVDNEEDDGDCVILDGDPNKPMAIGNNGGNDSGNLFAEHVDNEEDGGDDCVILDSDPDKPVAIENNGGNDSGDLCLVGEKGQVACRDYPHPRHLCVKFPFNSTPHERHCDKCYCYVCDSVAPCVHWGNGVSNIDHCHATEKNAFWEAYRKGAKTSHKAPPLVSEVGLTPMNQVPLLCSNPFMHNQELPTGQTCSVTSTGTPYGVMPVRTHESRGDPSNKFLPHLVGYHMQRQSAGDAGTQLSPQHVPFKRPGTSGGIFATIKHLNSSSRNNYGYLLSANESLGSRLQDPIEMGNQMLTTYECTQANSGGVALNTVPNSSSGSPVGIEIENYAPLQVYPRIHNCSVNGNSVASHLQLSSQTCLGSNLGNLMSTAPGVATQQSWGSHLANPMSLQPQAAYQPNVCQNVAPAQLVVVSRGSINYPSENSSSGSPVGIGIENYAPLQVYPHVHSGSVNGNSVAPHLQLSSQTCLGSNLGNLMSTAPGVATQQSWGSQLANPMSLQPQAAYQPNVYQHVAPAQLVVVSHGRINYPSESSVDSYGETSMSQNSQSFPAETTPTISQIFMGDNLGNLMPGVTTQQSLHYLCNPEQLPTEMSQNVVPTQLQVTSHDGNAESSVTSMMKFL